MTDENDNSILKNTGLTTIATLLSRLTGLARTWVMAFALGNTFITSAYTVAYNLPNLIFELVAGGMLAAAFLPIYLLQREKDGVEAGNRFANNVLNLAIVILGGLSILATVYADAVVGTQTFTVDQSNETVEAAVLFFRLFAIQIVLYGIGGVISGLLAAHRSYFVSNVAPMLNNLLVIAGFIAYIPLSESDPYLACIVLGVLTSAGVLIQFVVQIPALMKTDFRYSPRIDLKDPALIDAMKLAAPTILFIVGSLISTSCRNAFSMGTGETGPSMLNYAWIWYQLPYGVVAASLSRVLFTEISEASARDDEAAVRRFSVEGISGTLFMIIPLTGLIFILATPIMQIFRAGAFTQDDVYLISLILQLWILSLPLYSIKMFLYDVFAGIRKFVVFAVASAAMVALQVVLYALLTPSSVFGLAGIPVADFFYYLFGAALMLILLRRYIGAFSFKPIISTTIRTSLATFVGMAVTALIVMLTNISPSIALALAQIVFAGGLGLVSFLLVAKLLKVPEMRLVDNILDGVKRRLPHRNR